MTATKQSQAIQSANTLISNAAQLFELYQSIKANAQQFSDLNVGGLLNSLSTAALNADGSLGAADVSPNNANPLDTRLYGLSRSVSANQLNAMINTLNFIVTFVECTGSVAQQSGVRANLSAMSGG